VEAGRAGVSRRSEASLGRHIGRTTRQIDRNTKQLREDSEAIRKTLASIAREPDAPLLSPWTLANELVWNDTHRFAAKTFVAGGLLGLILDHWAAPVAGYRFTSGWARSRGLFVRFLQTTGTTGRALEELLARNTLRPGCSRYDYSH
jgi:hypothetical protein